MSTTDPTAQQGAAAAAIAAVSKPVSSSSAGAPATAGTGGATGATALNALSGNFQSFLGMLMTQLKNQDPSSPMDSNQFTQELVAFSGVEQQINTNNSLTRLIQLTQSGELMQAAAMTGKQVQVQSSEMPLQNGSGSVQFSLPSAAPVAIAVATQSGMVVKTATLNATAGPNNWTWDGKSDAGAQLPDGAYQVSVFGAGTGGTSAAVPFTVRGTVTGSQSVSGSGLQLQLGGLTVPYSAVQSMKN